MLIVFRVFPLKTNQPKKPVRTSNACYSLSGWVKVNIPSLAYKYAAKSCIDRPSTSVIASVASNTNTQWQMKAYMTTLKSMGDRGLFCMDKYWFKKVDKQI